VVRDVKFAARLSPPSAQHWFGTDDFGRDLFSMVLLAAHLDLKAALTVVLSALGIGVVLGAIAGLVRRLDEPIMRVTDVFLSIPSLVLAMAIASVLGRSLENLSLALVFVSWPIYCRLMRGQVLTEKQKPYVNALRTLGVGHTRMIVRHIVPNTIFPVIARAPADAGLVLITMAALSYIGFGPGPYVPEWGSLVAAGQAYIFQAPWLVVFPGVAIFLTSLSLNLVGDWARDVFDPRLMAGGPVLEVRDLSVELSIGGRWVPALQRVSLGIRRGEALGVVGESGSGKSLTALSIAGLLPANARVVQGSIRLNGDEVVGKPEPELNRLRARGVALVFQNPMSYLNPVLTIGEQIAEIFTVRPELLDGAGGWSRRTRRREAWRRSVEALRLVRVPDPEGVVTRYPFQLSGGMQQRAVIAMALVRRPALIIADEVTTALDVTVQAQILTLLSELRRTVGMTLLLITHDMGIVAQLADRVAVMYSGSVVESAGVASLFGAPRHPYSRALLETVPTIDGGRTVFRPIPGSMPALTDPPAGCRFHPRCPRVAEPCASVKPEPRALAAGVVVACHSPESTGP
jgi:peptide/nickel transport system permease protein